MNENSLSLWIWFGFYFHNLVAVGENQREYIASLAFAFCSHFDKYFIEILAAWIMWWQMYICIYMAHWEMIQALYVSSRNTIRFTVEKKIAQNFISFENTELNARNVVKTDKNVLNVQRTPQRSCNASITHGATKPSDYSFPFSCISWHSIA